MVLNEIHILSDADEECMKLTARQLEVLQHTVGVDQYGRGPKYRNYFCAGDDDETVCRELVSMGYMKQHPTTDNLPYFNCSATDDGIRAMMAESPKPPKLTRGQQRYADWLKVSDFSPDMKFIDYCRMKDRAEDLP
jgi:hypothetical protein